MKNIRLILLVTLLTLLAAGQGAWAQAMQEVGVAFSFSQNQTWYRYSITPSNLASQQYIIENQSNSYVEFNSAKDNDQYAIGDSNIPLTMNLNGKVSFNNAGNFTVDNGGSLFRITFTSTTKYIMGARVTTNNDVTVANCAVEGAGTKSVIVKIPDQSIFSKVILTIANHTPLNIGATISGIEDTYLDDGENEPVPTVTYRESSNSAPVTLTAGTDYTVSYKNNHYLGTATLTVTGTGNYIGSVSKDYNIRSYDLSDFNPLGNNTYEIATKDDLDHLAIYVNRGNDCNGVTFKQTADIAYTYQYAWNNIKDTGTGSATNILTENNYTAIGGYGQPFNGTYDGQGHSISGIRIKKVYAQDGDYAGSQGLFGFLGDNGTVQNVIVKDAMLDAYTNVGGIVGYNSGTVSNCIAYHVRVIKGADMSYITNGRGPITGYSNSTVTDSYYRDCAAAYADGIIYNRRLDNVFAVTVAAGVSATPVDVMSVTIDGVTYYTEDSTFTLSYTGDVPTGGSVVYTATKTSNGSDVTSAVLSGTTLTIPAYDVTVTTNEWAQLQTALTNSSTDADNPTVITLACDVVATSTDTYLEITSGHHVILDLNGKALQRNVQLGDCGTDAGHVIKVRDNSSLTITDSSTGGTGTLSGGDADKGGAFYVAAGGMLIINGGTVENCQVGNLFHISEGYGSAIYNLGTLIINGGTIQNCTATSGWGQGTIYNSGDLTINGGIIRNNTALYGGAIYNNNGWTTTINGGTIQNNSAAGDVYSNDGIGGGIVNFGILNVYGGTIQGNSSSREGGGIWLSDEGSIFMKGNPVIKDNIVNSNNNNVYIPESRLIFAVGNFTEGAFIGVTTSTDLGERFAKGYGSYTLTANDASHFSSDTGAYYVCLKDDNAAYFTDDVNNARIVGTTLTGHQNGGVYWATFYHSSCRFALPEGAAAYTMGSNHKLYRLGNDGRVIPENTAVVIIADCEHVRLKKIVDDAEVTDHAPGTNWLQGSDSAVTVTDGKVDGKTPHVLSLVGSTIGFHPFTGTEIPAGKAYYVTTP